MVRGRLGQVWCTSVPANRIHGAVEADVAAEPVDDGLDRVGGGVRHVFVVAQASKDVVERRE